MDKQLEQDMRTFIIADIESEFGLVSYVQRGFADLTARLYNWAEQTDSYSVVLDDDGTYYVVRKP